MPKFQGDVPDLGRAAKNPAIEQRVVLSERLTLKNGLTITEATFAGWAITSAGLPSGIIHIDVDLGDDGIARIGVPPHMVRYIYRVSEFPARIQYNK